MYYSRDLNFFVDNRGINSLEEMTFTTMNYAITVVLVLRYVG